MKVFNTCLIIVRRHFASFVMYFGIFMALSVVMTTLSADSYSTDFTDVRPKFSVINRDAGSPLADGLVTYLSRHGEEVVLEDRRDVLQDATFYHATDYIAILPKGFRDAFWNGEALQIETVATTEAAKSYYADSLVNQYMNLARVYLAAGGMDEDALVAAVLNDLSAEAAVEKKRFGTGAPVSQGFQIHARMSCYIVMILLILCISNIMSAFRRPDLRMRNMCAPVKPRSVSGQQILCGVLVGVTAWLLLTALGLVMHGSQLDGTDPRIILLIILNSFVFTMVALALATLASSFIRSPNTQNAVANFLALGLSFLGGVFVPLEFLSEGLLTAAKFTPTYWYVTALDHICSQTSFDTLNPIWQAMLMQLAFAAAMICVALVIGKHQNQSEQSFGSTQTELDS